MESPHSYSLIFSVPSTRNEFFSFFLFEKFLFREGRFSRFAHPYRRSPADNLSLPVGEIFRRLQFPLPRTTIVERIDLVSWFRDFATAYNLTVNVDASVKFSRQLFCFPNCKFVSPKKLLLTGIEPQRYGHTNLLGFRRGFFLPTAARQRTATRDDTV